MRLGSSEVMPAVIYGKTGQVKEMPLDYFIVNVSHGSPIDKHGFNILQYFDFPHENRASVPTVSGSSTDLAK
jgi:hypothetical protein